MIKLVAIDLDDTLLTKEKKIINFRNAILDKNYFGHIYIKFKCIFLNILI